MTIELTLPPDLEAYVREQAASEDGKVSQFLTRLVIEERDRVIRRAMLQDELLTGSTEEQTAYLDQVEAEIENTLLRRLERNDGRPVTDQDWQELRRAVAEAADKRRNGANHG
jgi:hypothetical protein